ncbi:MAG TPA: hypothetical protein VF855_00875, partial [Acidimicrobiales bacterium]
MVREEQRGAADLLLNLVMRSSAHLWHNRPGVDVDGLWLPATSSARYLGVPARPGLFVPAAVDLYDHLLEINELDAELMARFGSWAITESEWRDLKIACAALLLVQPRWGAPVRDDNGVVLFHDDDF